MRNYLSVILFSVFLPCCSEEYSYEGSTKNCNNFPLLTGKVWTSDTIYILPPVTYNQLSNSDKALFDAQVDFFTNASVKFGTDCTLAQLSGNWDFAYQSWSVNANNELIARLQNGGTSNLRNWFTDGTTLSYEVQLPNFAIKCVFR